MIRLSILFFCTALIASCGYHFAGLENNLPPEIRSLAIVVFENRTSESEIENYFTNDLIFEFTRSKILAVAEKKDADAILTGTITEMGTEIIAHTAEVVSAEKRVFVRLDVELQRADNGNILWCDREFTEKEEYVVETDKLRTEANKKSAIRSLSRRAAEKIHNRIFQNF